MAEADCAICCQGGGSRAGRDTAARKHRGGGQYIIGKTSPRCAGASLWGLLLISLHIVKKVGEMFLGMAFKRYLCIAKDENVKKGNLSATSRVAVKYGNHEMAASRETCGLQLYRASRRSSPSSRPGAFCMIG